MSRIEELLRESLADTPATTATQDPIGALEARIRRARRRLAAAGTALVALAVAGAVLIPAALVGDSARPKPPLRHPTPSPSAADLQSWPAVPHAMSMATTPDGRVWTLQELITSHKQVWRVVVQDSAGAVVQRLTVPGPARGIAAGAGGVWTYGGGDGAYPDGVLNEISPPTGAVRTLRFDGSGPYDVAFVDGHTYVTLASAHRVVAVDFDRDGRLVERDSVVLPSQVTDIATTLQGDVWVLEDIAGRVVHVVDGRGGLRVGASFHWRGGLIGTGPVRGIWTVDSAHRLINLDPRLAAHGSMSLAEGLRIGVAGQPMAVVENGWHGGWVGTTRGLLYYDDFQQANSAAQANTTASADLPGGVVVMTGAPGGGVIAISGHGRSVLWPPAE